MAKHPAPYRQPEANAIYNLLFCDDLGLFRPQPENAGEPPFGLFFAEEPDVEAIRALATDPEGESRVRLLAHYWLRDHGMAIPGQELFGTVVEVPLKGGLDTLAAYPDLRVRYINQTGRMSIIETSTRKIQTAIRALMVVSKDVVSRIGPWDKDRLPEPQPGMIRMSFLVQDGLYFGQGPFESFLRDSMAGPVIERATHLLNLVVDESLKQPI